ncbi:MAG: isocitrate lyase/PEP mutase family protein [Sporolactobacillus sp.]|nr:isocitrate lyase/PEP mutase family protein [Sporolactobacillus sp.]
MTDDLCSGLRAKIESGASLLVPGIFDGISARLAEDAGFPGALISGIDAEGTLLASDQYGLLSMSERARHLRYIRQTVAFPLFVDAESGFGNALNTFYTARELERSGATALILNDQAAPAISEFFQNLKVISTEEMIGKLHAAKDALDNPKTLIIARTDCLSVDGLDGAMNRIRHYQEAGADLVIIGGVTDRPTIAKVAELSDSLPIGIDVMEGRNSDCFTTQELFTLGFRIVFHPAAALFAAVQAEKSTLQALKKDQPSNSFEHDAFGRLFGNRFAPGKKVSR